MNNTEQHTEPLAAIVAEMRDGIHTGRADIIDCVNDRLRSYADRIEVAAKRERVITDIMLAVKDKPLPHPYPDDSPPLFFPMTKTQLQTLSDLVAIAHDEMDGLPHYEQELERFDSLLFDMKARYAFDKPYTAPGNAAAMRDALEYAREVLDLNGFEEPVVRCESALATPARNCDRPFRSANEAIGAYVGERGDGPHLGYCDAIKWALAPAEGGAE